MDEDNRLSALREKQSEDIKKFSESVDKLREDYAHEHEFLRWDRETYAKLYYPLWILFMGGFVFSLNTDKYHEPVSRYLIALIYLFRIVAICGTALNFYVQRIALVILRYEWETEVYLRWAQRHCNPKLRNISTKDLSTHKEIDESIADGIRKTRSEIEELSQQFDRASEKRVLSKQMDQLLKTLENWLLVCSAVFLILILILTWRIIP